MPSLDKYLSARSRDRHSVKNARDVFCHNGSEDEGDFIPRFKGDDIIVVDVPVMAVNAARRVQITSAGTVRSQHGAQPTSVDSTVLYQGWIQRKQLL